LLADLRSVAQEESGKILSNYAAWPETRGFYVCPEMFKTIVKETLSAADCAKTFETLLSWVGHDYTFSLIFKLFPMSGGEE
jgi:hypothetical protein